MAMIAALHKFTAPLKRRIRLMISRSVLRAADDERRIQELRLAVLEGESMDRVQRFQEYGFTSRPLPGAEAIGVAVGASRGHFVAVAVDDRRHRKRNLKEGEVALYTDEGDFILLARGRVMEIVAGAALNVTAPEVTVTATTQVTIDTPQMRVTGDLSVDGEVSDHSGTVQGVRDTYNGHTHTGDTGGTTSTPHQEMG